ncbi:hypothetical protein C0991_011708, partial [Blastosporella zonata]
MPPSKLPTRSEQPTTKGLGVLFNSPKKRRDKKKTATLTNPFGRTQEIERLRIKLEALKRQHKTTSGLDTPITDESEEPALQPETEATPDAQMSWDWDTALDDPLPSVEFVESTQTSRP